LEDQHKINPVMVYKGIRIIPPTAPPRSHYQHLPNPGFWGRAASEPKISNSALCFWLGQTCTPNRKLPLQHHSTQGSHSAFQDKQYLINLINNIL